MTARSSSSAASPAASSNAPCSATTSPSRRSPCEILPSREFYDYDDKYLLDQAQTVIPANLSPEQTAEMQRLAVECYSAVECEGMARVDFLLEEHDRPAVHQRDQHHSRDSPP